MQKPLGTGVTAQHTAKVVVAQCLAPSMQPAWLISQRSACACRMQPGRGTTTSCAYRYTSSLHMQELLCSAVASPQMQRQACCELFVSRTLARRSMQEDPTRATTIRCSPVARPVHIARYLVKALLAMSKQRGRRPAMPLNNFNKQ